MEVDSPAIARHRVTRARRLGRAGLVVVLIAMMATSAGGLWPGGVVLLGMAGYLLAVALFVASFTVWFGNAERPGHVAVRPDALVLGSAAVVPRAAIASSYLVVREGAPLVEVVEARGDAWAIAVPDERAGEALVTALGFGPGGRRQTIALPERRRRLLHIGLGFAAYQAVSFLTAPILMGVVTFGRHYELVSPIMSVSLAVLVPLVYRYFRKKAQGATLVVGDDGLTVHRGTTRRFYPRGKIVGAQVDPRTKGLLLGTSHGHVLVDGFLLDPARSQAVADAMRARWSAPLPAPARVAPFLRAGRELSAWCAELQSRVGGVGYRDGAAISTEDAEAVLRSPVVPAEARLGAALVLAAAGERVRIAAAMGPTCDEDLLEAVDALAEGHPADRQIARVLGKP